MSRDSSRKPLPAVRIALLSLVVAAALCWPAQARPWKPTPNALAVEYALIEDTRADNSLTIVFWLVPQLAADEREVAKVLDDYIILIAVHGNISPAGITTFDSSAVLDVKNGEGKSLKQLKGDDIPPTVAGMTTAFQGVVRKMLGAMGEGMHSSVYENGGIHSCKKGQLQVGYAGETYTYDTPFPGCPAQ